MISGWLTRFPGERETPSGIKRITAHYVEMRDGVKIAIDVLLPENYQSDQKIPALMTMTRYWRDQQVGFLGRALTGLGLLNFGKIGGSKYIFNLEGYAIVSVDARGTGASFGSRKIEWDPEEIKDYGEIASWIIKQSWSNGRVGAYGVSYDGNTAELITLNHHPAVKAVAPFTAITIHNLDSPSRVVHKPITWNTGVQ